MKVQAPFRHYHHFELWTPVVVDATATYVKDRDDVGTAIPSSGGYVYLLTKDPLDLGAQVRNLTDRGGAPVFNVAGSEYTMYVTTAEPSMDPYGFIVGWRHSLRRDLPKDVEAILERLVDGLNVT